jgi:hypothetical protein
VLLAGDPAPGSPAATLFGALDEHVFPTARGLMFGAQVSGVGTFAYGRTGGGALALVARDGDPAPGGGFFSSIGSYRWRQRRGHRVPQRSVRILHGRRHLSAERRRHRRARRARHTGRARDSRPLLLRPDGPADQRRRQPALHRVDRRGRGDGCQPTAESVLFGPDGAGGLAPIAKTGDVAPDTGGGTFVELGARGVSQIYLGLDDADRVSVAATATGGTIVDTKWGIWGPTGGGVALRLLALEGGAAARHGRRSADHVVVVRERAASRRARAADTVFRPQADAGLHDQRDLGGARREATLNLVAVEGQALADPVVAPSPRFRRSSRRTATATCSSPASSAVSFSDIRDGLWLGHATAERRISCSWKGDMIDVGGGFRELSFVDTAKAWSGGEDGKGQGSERTRGRWRCCSTFRTEAAPSTACWCPSRA